MFGVLTLNCWGLPDLVTSSLYSELAFDGYERAPRSQRIAQIAGKLRDDPTIHIVALQEVWFPSDRRQVESICAEQYSICVFNAGAFGLGGGIIILSRFKILESDFMRYSLCGKPQRVHHGDFQGAKGVAYARVAINDHHCALLFSTHSVAEYNAAFDEYRAHRISEFHEALRFIEYQRRRYPKDTVILLGDLNLTPDQPLYRYLLSYGLWDSYADEGIPPGATLPHDVLSDGLPKRLDYILYSSQFYQAVSSEVAFKWEDHVIYSDHYGVLTRYAPGKAPMVHEDDRVACPVQDLVTELELGIFHCQKRFRVHLLRGILFLLLYFLMFSNQFVLSLAFVEVYYAVVFVKREIGVLRSHISDLDMPIQPLCNSTTPSNTADIFHLVSLGFFVFILAVTGLGALRSLVSS